MRAWRTVALTSGLALVARTTAAKRRRHPRPTPSSTRPAAATRRPNRAGGSTKTSVVSGSSLASTRTDASVGLTSTRRATVPLSLNALYAEPLDRTVAVLAAVVLALGDEADRVDDGGLRLRLVTVMADVLGISDEL